MTEEKADNQEEKSKLMNESRSSSEPKTKKLKVFSAKEFRNQLKTDEKLSALIKFSQLITSDTKQQLITEYLDSGGNCIELLQIIETDSSISPALIFKIVYHILLNINTNLPKYQPAAQEACRYLLNTYITLLNKMLSLNSSILERKTVLQLLTAVITISATLAKDVLLQINLNPTNIELLSKSTNVEDSVRSAFINFLTAFLVDGQYPTLAVLLEKRGLLTSIIKGLQYDQADCVCMVITALKNHVLENPLVSKTVKMKVFSTPVVKDIVNLYNWKGPTAIAAKNKETKTFEVDEHDKSKVSQYVHDFLLVLCTSHKYGVIFRDRNLAASKRHQNSLMYTVLESLNKPWEHSYAGELVRKICKACPDLTKALWSNLKPCVEPRETSGWIKTIHYAEQLLDEIEPSCIEYCAKDLKVHQLAQTVQFLVAPTPILKSVIPDFNSCKSVIKYSILKFLIHVLKAVNSYVLASKNWLTFENYSVLKHLLCEHVSRNFPDAKDVLKDWKKIKHGDSELLEFTKLDYLNASFDLFDYYKDLCPQLLESLAMQFNLNNLFQKILNTSQIEKDACNLFVKAVSLFLCISPDSLLPNKVIFSLITTKLLEFYYENTDNSSRSVLYDLFKNTSIFEGCETEINIWIDGVLNQKNSDSNLYELIVASLKQTYKNYNKYLDQISELSNEVNVNSGIDSKVRDFLQNISEENIEVTVKNTNLSSLILGVLEASTEIETTKSIKTYMCYILYNLLHLQTNSDIFLLIINDANYCNSELIPASFVDYANCWKSIESEVKPITKFKGRFSFLQNLSEAFLNSEIKSFLDENADKLQQHLNLLHMCMYYFTNFIKRGEINERILRNCETFVDYLTQNNFTQNHPNVILGHPVLLQNFSPLHVGKKGDVRDVCTKFVIYSVKHVKSELYLKAYRSKVLKSVLKVLKKSSKQKANYENLMETIETFQLDHKQCLCVLSTFAHLIETNNFPEQNSISFSILIYTFGQFLSLSTNDMIFEPLESKIVQQLSSYLKHLNTVQSNTSVFAKLLLSYLEIFPHNVQQVNSQLFESILTKNEYCKENCNLAAHLLSQNCKKYSEDVKKHVELVCSKKGLVLPLLDVIIRKNIPISDVIYANFKPAVIKSLQKPQKAGQQFEKYYTSVAYLINKYFSIEECKNYVEKVQKFDVSEPFHVYLLTTVYQKYLSQDKNCTEVHVSNSILTLVHLSLQLFKKKDKSEEDWQKHEKITEYFCEYVGKLKNVSCKQLLQNETFNLFCKFCLKFGVSGKMIFLKILSSLSNLLNLEESHASLLLEMIVSHSEFLDVVLGKDSECKLELLKLFLVLVQQWPSILKKNHVSVVLAAYQATEATSDRCVLTILKICEKNAEKTHFYNFKPLLWGSAAAGHYSVRTDIHNALWRQPKIGDVLNILQDHLVINTIKNHSLSSDLYSSNTEINHDQTLAHSTYDLTFLLPLFDQLLAPENAVQTYRFTKSGAIALTIVALGSYSENVRKAACHVLSRFYYHLEAKQTGKDNLLWLRFIEAVCKGTAVLENFILNSFAAIFLARMALVLTQPGHVMYVPLCQYLGAKSAPDFTGIPELYTFLHSCDVNYKEHRNFVLQVLRDGMRSEKDFEVALHSMAFKLIMELFNSCSVSDIETKKLILEVFKKACRIFAGVQLLCSSYAFLSWLYCVTKDLNEETVSVLLLPIIEIVSIVFGTVENEKSIDLSVVGLILTHIVDEFLKFTTENVMIMLLQCLCTLLDRMPHLFNRQKLENITKHTDNKYCQYLLKYDCKYISTLLEVRSSERDVSYYVKQLTLKWLTISRK